MLCDITITLPISRKIIFQSFCSEFSKYLLAEDLPGQTAGYEGDVVEVGVGYQVPEDSQEVANLRRVDVGLVEVGVDQMRKPDNGVEQVTKGKMQNQGDRI